MQTIIEDCFVCRNRGNQRNWHLRQGQFQPKELKNFGLYITRVLPITAELVCADNTGAKVLRIAQVGRYKGRHSRLPAGAVGDLVTVTVKKGAAE